MPRDGWQFWLDVGGTFTDCLARRPDGGFLRRKVLSSAVVKGVVAAVIGPGEFLASDRAGEAEQFWRGYRLRLLLANGETAGEWPVTFSSNAGRIRLEESPNLGQATGLTYELISPEDAPLLAIRQFLGLPLAAPIPPVTVRLGTTRGTNALLTRQGASTALVATRGFADMLAIGWQNRPKLFDLVIRKPTPLYQQVIEIDERLTADGQVLSPLDEPAVRKQLAGLRNSGVESLAICLLHSYLAPDHERRVARIAAEFGFRQVSLSSEVSPLIRILSRGATTVVDAYLGPVLQNYVARLAEKLPGSDLWLCTSAGGLCRPESFTGKDSVLSGPAGGVIGFSRAAEAAGLLPAIGFDMGGTSTDVSRYAGRYEYEFETEKAGVRLTTPMLAIETVAAGGGSICRFDGVKLVVGPESAGADPGPACYGRGGPLTITDCNVLLGRVPADHFPFPLDRAAASRRLVELRTQMKLAGTPASEETELAEGCLRIANAKMAQAIQSVSLAKGFDPRDHTLVAFGAAGPQHACAVARELGIRRVLIHPDASVMCALGIGLANVTRIRTAAAGLPWQEVRANIEAIFQSLAQAAQAEVAAEGVSPPQITVSRSLAMRYQGTEATIDVAEPTDGDYAAALAAEHQRMYGYLLPQRAAEVVAARVEAVGRAADELPTSRRVAGDLRPTIGGEGWPRVLRKELAPGQRIRGPLLIVEPLTTTVVEDGFEAEVWSGGELVLTDLATPAAGPVGASETADPVLLELFNNRFTAIAEQMGIRLRNTASSVNVKERLDFSCALFTREGDLIVNAPHIPVHLGAMSETVKAVIADNGVIRRGDVFATNDPYRGGSHLPDVTVVSPVFLAGDSPTFFTASRAHHAEIGGVTPGSMPPFSRRLSEEGVLIRNFHLIAGGVSRTGELRRLLLTAEHPTRAIDDNLADLAAQVAANQQGALDLARLAERHSLGAVLAYTKHIQSAAERKMRRAIHVLGAGRREFVDHLDDGAPIHVALTASGGDEASARLTIDFTGTGGVLDNNLNANRAIVTAAVLYVMRLWIGEEIPLNQGVLAPLELILPTCLLNPPGDLPLGELPAIVGGNTETSQRVVDVLLGALGLAAASQGTMNNLLFGDRTFGYYETIGGGAGATVNAPGACGVHTHMTNTRLTDPEVLERRYPVRLHQFAIRRGSGGSGRQRGGDGIIRQIEFLRPLELSILSQRRGPYPPYGLAGGMPGAWGRNTLIRADGTMETLPGRVQLSVQPGDRLILETPGGGGYGRSDS